MTVAATAPPRLSRPMSAFEFLTEELPRVVREEPRRLRMGCWLSTDVVQVLKSFAEDMASHDDADSHAEWFTDDDEADWSTVWRRAPEFTPACNTVGCIAGWTLVMTGQQHVSHGFMDAAAATLGLTYEQACDLFTPSDDLCTDPEQGTAAHAERVIVHVLAFAAKHEGQLRARELRFYGE